MTLSEYNLLEGRQQYDILWDNGTFLGDRFEGKYKYALYQLDGFYAEIKYHYENNSIEGLRAFRNANQLEPYLMGIDISECTK